jgi:hypothetical protein
MRDTGVVPVHTSGERRLTFYILAHPWALSILGSLSGRNEGRWKRFLGERARHGFQKEIGQRERDALGSVGG